VNTYSKGAAAWTGSGRGRLEGVDVIRGLCIMNVVLHHVNIRIHFAKSSLGTMLPESVIRALFWTGDYSVKIFFVVSGFLITSSILARWGSLEKIDWKNFYRMRFARIAPCLLALLAVLSILHLAKLLAFTIPPEKSSLARALFAALTFHSNWLEARAGYLPGSWDVLWSLSVEEAFYLAYPLLCRFVRSRAVLLGVGALLLVLGPIARTHAFNQIWSDYSYLGGMDAISIGCVTAMVARTNSILRVPLWPLSGSGTLLILTVWFRGLAQNLHLLATGLDVTVLAIGAALVILAVSRSGGSQTKQLLNGRLTAIFRWYGRNSYEVYLTHMFVVLIAVQVFERIGEPMNTAPFWFLGILTTAGILGAVVARWFSEPMNHRLRALLIPRPQFAQPAKAVNEMSATL
jgi:peptidoglycan/LPS O-acetylase OafA/YrhL